MPFWEQAAVSEESLGKLGSTSCSGGGLSGLAADGFEVFSDELRQVGARQMAPEILDGIKFRRIRRQVFRAQPIGLRGDPLLHSTTAVRGQAVPEQDRLSPAHMSLQRFQVRQHLRLFDCAWFEPQTQPHSASLGCGDQTGDGRQTLPIERRYDDRCLTTWRPGAAYAGSFGKPAFIQKNQQGAGVAGLFLIRGQRYRTHRRMASSLRSRALRSGRWQLQPN